MFLGLFKKKAKLVKVDKKREAKKAAKPKTKAKKQKLNKLKTKGLKLKKISAGRRAKKPAVKKTVRRKAMPKIVGKVTHYFPHVKAGVILITDGTISIGDKLQIKGHTTDFKQQVDSMQIDSLPINKAAAGKEIGLRVKSRVRHNDVVYKL